MGIDWPRRYSQERLEFVSTSVLPDASGNNVFIILEIENIGDYDSIIDNCSLTYYPDENRISYCFSNMTVKVGETTTLYIVYPKEKPDGTPITQIMVRVATQTANAWSRPYHQTIVTLLS